ncbi:MAG: hypothetical protein KDA41_00480, partial [Planctomycetales bacterium]|nr:hypothetical protein [Planctomycetales bacterium]
MPRGISRWLAAPLFVVVLSLIASVAHAGNDTWNGNVNNLWPNSGNWVGFSPPGPGETATFDNAGSGNTTIDLNGFVQVNTLLFDTGAAAAYTIGDGPVNSQTLKLDNLGAITINNTVTTNQLINAGLDINAGDVTFTNNGTGDLTIGGNILNLTADRVLNIAGSGNVALAGNIIDNAATRGRLTVTKTSSGDLSFTFPGSIEVRTLNVNSAAGLVQLGAGTTILLDNDGAAGLTSSTGGTITGGTIQLQTSGANGDDNGTAAGTTLTINSL